MEAGLAGTDSRPPGIPWPAVVPSRGFVMKWETPQASDQRFGFEITMYISTR
jgi:coenzyme PQQ precursor peptide PqqA